MARKRRYGWALALSSYAQAHPKQAGDWDWLEPPAFTDLGWEGIHYAAELAINALERRQGALDRNIPYRLTQEDLARNSGESASYVSRAIRQARTEVFGRNLTDSAIDYRRRNQRSATLRACADPHCRTQLSPGAPTHRRYCKLHGTTRERVRRSRAEHQR
jgi:hypothetical protein